MAGENAFRFDDTERDLAFRRVDNGTPTHLTSAQIEHFNREGFVSPLPCFDRDEAAELRTYFDWLVDAVVSADDWRNSYSINN